MKILINLIFVSFLIFETNAQKKISGNPIFEGWYADPEAMIFDNKYWVFPTFSAKYKE
jgi:hypothetical protein